MLLYIYIQGNSTFILQLFYQINIQNYVNYIVQQFLIWRYLLWFHNFIITYNILECFWGVNFRSSNGNLHFFLNSSQTWSFALINVVYALKFIWKMSSHCVCKRNT